VGIDQKGQRKPARPQTVVVQDRTNESMNEQYNDERRRGSGERSDPVGLSGEGKVLNKKGRRGCRIQAVQWS